MDKSLNEMYKELSIMTIVFGGCLILFSFLCGSFSIYGIVLLVYGTICLTTKGNYPLKVTIGFSIAGIILGALSAIISIVLMYLSDYYYFTLNFAHSEQDYLLRLFFNIILPIITCIIDIILPIILLLKTNKVKKHKEEIIIEELISTPINGGNSDE